MIERRKLENENSMIRSLVESRFGERVLRIQRQHFGHNSITFDIQTPSRCLILRTNAKPEAFLSTENNLQVLRDMKLPVSEVLACDLSFSQVPFGYMFVAKFPGRDLNYELPFMSEIQMTRLAETIVGYQRKVGELAEGDGFGWVGIGDRGTHQSWQELIEAEKIFQLREPSQEIVSRISKLSKLLPKFQSYMQAVRPICFLDDITVKNVIMMNGELQGLIDFDCVCYGDPLYWIALTATGIVSDIGLERLFYVEELRRFWGLTELEERALALYSALFGLDFYVSGVKTQSQAWRNRMLFQVDKQLERAGK